MQLPRLDKDVCSLLILVPIGDSKIHLRHNKRLPRINPLDPPIKIKSPSPFEQLINTTSSAETTHLNSNAPSAINNEQQRPRTEFFFRIFVGDIFTTLNIRSGFKNIMTDARTHQSHRQRPRQHKQRTTSNRATNSAKPVNAPLSPHPCFQGESPLPSRNFGQILPSPPTL